jgi:hypothetical protein
MHFTLLYPRTFVSDAAGAALQHQPHNVVNISEPEDRGVASLGYNEHSYIFCSILKWPLPLPQKFGSNSTILEIVGLLLPFLCIPQQLRDKNVLLLVENQAVVCTWRKRMSPHCEYVSLITQSLHLIEAMLPCIIYVEHITRCSSPQSILVDQLSCTSTTHERVLQEIRHLRPHTLAGPLN